MNTQKVWNLFFPLLSFASIFPSHAKTAEASKHPNIILIMADDLGWGDVGFNGNPIVQTPILDSLSTAGMRMDNFYSAAPLSSPTRASVLTGRNPFRTGVFSANVGILRPEETTLPELLKNNGYTTGHFGKWHLGTLTYKEVDANRGRPGNLALYNPPAQHGYDEAFVTESKVPTYDPMIQPVNNNGCFWDYVSEQDSVIPYGTFYWNIHGEKVTDGLKGDDSKIIMDRVIPFIQSAIDNQQPFLSVVWFHAPHLPCVAGKEYADLYQGLSVEERNYFGCITAMDEQIGRLVHFLQQKQIDENTIILFCSDNGPELNTPGTAGEFRGKKRSLHEGGIRVPAFMVWKGKVRAGSSLAVPCTTSDYLPTIMEIIGADSSQLPILDGESFWQKVSGVEKTRRKNLVFCSGNQGSVIGENYKLYYSKGIYELYNIQNDPFEKHDIASENPIIVDHMKNYLLKEMENYKQTFLGKEYGDESYQRVNQKWWNIFNNE